MEVFFIFLFIVILVIIVITIAIAPNRNRSKIQDTIAQNGGQLESIEWKMFGKDFVSDKYYNYIVTYKDKYGNLKRATVKTMLNSGVYFGDEETLLEADVNSAKKEVYTDKQATNLSLNESYDLKKLKEELHRLKLENARLKDTVEELLRRK